jgi:hypothetical protein
MFSSEREAGRGRTTSSTIDLASGLRRIKAHRRRDQVIRRPAEALVSASDVVGDGRAALLLDANVYIGSIAGTLPGPVETLLDRGLLFHCAVGARAASLTAS